MRIDYRLYVVLFIFCFSIFKNGYSQTVLISVNVIDIPVSQLLNQISSDYKIRFAFDDDQLSKQKITLQVSNKPVEDLLKVLVTQFQLDYRFIGGTYVIVKSNKPKVEPPKKTVANKTPQKIIEKPTVIIEIETEPQPKLPDWLEISGQISDAITGEKLNRCQVIFDSTKELLTNNNGFFWSKEPYRPTIQLTIVHLGYQRIDTLLTATANTIVNIRLRPMTVMLQSIDIKGREKYLIEMPDIAGLIAFNPLTSVNNPGIEPNDMINALTYIPGIVFQGGQNTGISIRGGAPTENMVLLDGIPILETGHLMGNLSVLNSKFIQQAFVSRGAFGPEYGGRVSGIVDLTGKSGNEQKPVVDITANMLHTNAFVALPLGKRVSVSAAYRQAYGSLWPNYLYRKLAIDNSTIESTSENLTGNLEEASIGYNDLNARISYRPNPYKELVISYFNSADAQKRDYQFPTDGKYYQNAIDNAQNRGYAAKWTSQATPQWANTVTAGYSKTNRIHDLIYGKEPNKTGRGDMKQTDYSSHVISELLTEWKSVYKFDKHEHAAGLGLTQNTIDNQIYYTEEKSQGVNRLFIDSLSIQGKLNLPHLFYNGQVKLLNIINIKAGFRLNYPLPSNKLHIMPRAGIEIEPVRALKLSYHFGNYNQYLYRTMLINSNSRMVEHWFLAGSDQDEIRSTHHVAGIKFDRAGWLINLEAYSKNQTGKVIMTAESINAKKGKVIEYYNRASESINNGIDLFVQFRHGKFHHLLSYSLAQNFDQISGFNNNDYFPAPDDQRHRLRITEMLNLKSVIISSNWHIATGAPVISFDKQQNLIIGERLPYFSQFDISVIKQFKIKSSTIEAGFSVLNVFNRKNIVESNYFRLTGSENELSVKSDITAPTITPLFFINFKY